MKDRYDPWYVQLPDGRVVKAKSTASVRHHVSAGHIPLNSMARREHHETWQMLTRIGAFADLGSGGGRSAAAEQDLAPPAPSNNGSSADVNVKAGISARLDPMRLQTVGIRGLVDELIAAFDSTVSTGKLAVACTGCLLGSLAVFVTLRLALLASAGLWQSVVLGGVVGFAALSIVVALLTRQTHMELLKMRPVATFEARPGIAMFALRVFLGYAVTIGIGIGLLVLLGRTPEAMARAVAGMDANAAEALTTGVWLIGMVLQVCIFTMMLASLLVPPILIVEECTISASIREWRALLAEHRIRVMVYEATAVVLALVAALPLLLPVYLASIYRLPLEPHNWIAQALFPVLQAVALGPALAYLAVANLFIYLNLRYEYSPSK
jgi:hypothetical protein